MSKLMAVAMAVAATLHCSVGAAATGSQRLLTPKQLREDLAFLFPTLEDAHPNVFHIGKDNYARHKRALIESARRSQSVLTFSENVQRFLHELRDGHTAAEASNVPPCL